MRRDDIDPPDYGDGVTYVECLLLAHLDAKARAIAIARALITPCLAGEDGLDDMGRLHFWCCLVAHVLVQAEASLGEHGREAIVQTMRNTPASRAMVEVH